MSKIKKFDHELDAEVVNQNQMRDASNESLIERLTQPGTVSGDPDIQELCRRFSHALDCLAHPSRYHLIDVENFVKGVDKDLLPRTKKE